MRVTYSPDVEVLYVSVSDEPIAKTIEISDLIIVDVDAMGEAVGVEFAMRAELITEDMYRSVADRFPVLARSNPRAQVLERVVAAVRSEVGRKPLSDPNAEGQVDVIICLPSDTVQEAASAVASLGGYATVVVPSRMPEENASPVLPLLPLVWDMRPDGDTPLEVWSDPAVHPESQLGMLIDYLGASGRSGMSFRIAVGECREAAITESGPLVALA